MLQAGVVLFVAFVGLPARADVAIPHDGKIVTDIGRADVANQIPLQVVLTTQPLVRVKQPRIYLQDVASCAGPEFLCAELDAIDIGPAAVPGRGKTVLADRIKTVISLEYPNVKLSMAGSARLRVESQSVSISAKEVEDALGNGVRGILAGENSMRMKSMNVQLTRTISAWPGEYRLRFPILEKARAATLEWVVENLLGNRSWQVVYESVSRESSRPLLETAHVNLELEISLPVARRHLARGTVLKHEDLAYRWLRVTRRTPYYAMEIKDIVGLVTRQAIRLGEPIQFKRLEVPELVRRGSKVRMRLSRGGLEISGEGKALKSGGVGQMISVYYLATKKTLQGKILKDGSVEVKF